MDADIGAETTVYMIPGQPLKFNLKTKLQIKPLASNLPRSKTPHSNSL